LHHIGGSQASYFCLTNNQNTMLWQRQAPTSNFQETKRLYDDLSKEGKVIMPLADMFWGAYFGTCADKFGVNWMFNCPEPVK
jgi:uncharacterized glyoxalase superfamily protein PhnB